MKINFKKKTARFMRDNPDLVARVLESNLPEGLGNHLPFWEDLYTIKNTIDEFNPRKPKIFEITESNMTRGYVDADNAKAMHFIGPKKKLIKSISPSYYHSIADDLAEIVYGVNKYKNAELILDVSDIRKYIDTPAWDFVGFFLRCLDDKKIKYTLVELSKFDVLYINNFTLLTFPFHSGARLDMLSEFFSKYLSNPKEKPYRKVFVSRSNVGWKEPSEHAVNFSYQDDNRIDSHDKIEKIFVDLGFEIVDTDNFKTFQEQVDFFSSVKTLASLTSSGIVNAVFMKPGGTIVEVVTPLITQSPVVTDEYLKEYGINPDEYEIDVNTVQEIHMFYHNLAFFKEHSYVAIPNYYRDSDRIQKFIEANTSLKEFFEK